MNSSPSLPHPQTHKPTTSPSRAAFSLIEVNMAILVIAIGMLSLMSLFPLGLRESSLAYADMNQAAAADFMLGRIEANAMRITDWNEWNDAATMQTRLGYDHVSSGALNLSFVNNSQERQLNDFPGDGERMRYRLILEKVTDRRYRVSLRSSERASGALERNPVYYTEIFFRGMDLNDDD